MNPYFIVLTLILFSITAQASEPVTESEILAKRGKGLVTQATFTARAEKIPAKHRLGTLRDGNRLKDVINTLLLRSQLAADAREAGYDKGDVVMARMQLAAESELAEAWMQHYLEIQPEGDYEQIAREYYQLHQDEILSSPRIDVSHILIATKDRSEDEALELAESLSRQLVESPLEFDDMVTEYSDDPSASSNKGKFANVKKGDMVLEFESTAFALKANEISGPVKTTYGYHIIRLDAYIAPEIISFDIVKQQLIDTARQEHEQRISADYLGTLTSLDVEMSEESLEELVRRLFGEDFVDPFLKVDNND
jgi:peptidyl-prolyl cis-trans isomerase C